MKKHINADFFKLLLAFLLIIAGLNPNYSNATPQQHIFCGDDYDVEIDESTVMTFDIDVFKSTSKASITWKAM